MLEQRLMSETEICLLWWNLTFSNCLQKSSWLFWKGQNQVIKITVDISQLTYGKYRNDINFNITLAESRLREKRMQSRFRCSRRKTFRRLLVGVWSSGRASLSNCRESSSHRVLKFWFKKLRYIGKIKGNFSMIVFPFLLDFSKVKNESNGT